MQKLGSFFQLPLLASSESARRYPMMKLRPGPTYEPPRKESH